MFTFMLYAFFTFIGVSYQEQCVAPSNMVGTVLFTPSDVHKECWSPEEIAILTSRMILEQLMPDVKFLKIDSVDYVEDVVDYFREVIDTIRANTVGRKKRVLLLALTDLVGGYLHHAVLPVAKKAFYAGFINFKAMESLLQLYEEVKWYLRTNGQGWSPPVSYKQEMEVPIIDTVNDAKCNKSCCRKLIYYEHEPKKQTKRETHPSYKNIYFPLPFFDAKVHPTAIVVPLRKYALRNIESRTASYLLMKYFISAQQCLSALKSQPEVVRKFQDNLYTWISMEVLPRLDDEKFYSAFGGIWRVVETLKSAGAKILPHNATTKCEKVEEGDEQVGTIPATGESHMRSKTVLAAMLIIIFLWFILGTFFICYRMRKNKGGDKKSKITPSSSMSSTGWSSVWTKSSTKSKTPTTCKCCEEKSMGYSSTSTDQDYKKQKKNKPKSGGKAKSSPCFCPKNDDSPAVIDTKHSAKVLPSIAEMSENSSKEKNKSLRRISFVEDSNNSSSENKEATTKKRKLCVPKSLKLIPCPKIVDKSTSYSSTMTKYTAKDAGMQKKSSEDIGECLCKFVNEEDTNMGDSTSFEQVSKSDLKDGENEIHSYACHSSLAGNYSMGQQPNEKPFVFGYDFQTTSSSDVSEEDMDLKTSTSR